MRKVIITGGIGSGKSTVGNLLKELGVRVIDADEIAHQLLEIFQNDIVNLFGSHILKDGKIERKKLGNIIFNDKEKLTALEKFLHPKIAKIMLSEFNTCIKDHILAVLDIPLYFEKLENSPYKGFEIAVVYASKEVQIERVKRRDGLSEEQILARLNAQLSNEQKRQMADFVIDNNGSFGELKSSVNKFYKWLKESD